LFGQAVLSESAAKDDVAGVPLCEATADASEKRMWSTGDFELADWLGSGTYGHVQLAREKESKFVVALKVMKKRRVQRLRAQRNVSREIEIQRHLRHAHILRLFGFFWDASHIYLILEHAPGGDLGQRLQQEAMGRLEDAEAATLTRQLGAALAYLHQLHVMHRDVKPQNVLFSSSRRRPKLADFGWAVHTAPDEARWTLCGTLDYLSPEMVRNSCGHSFEIDVWGLGVLAYEMLVGEPPFAAPTHDDTCRRILAAAPTFPAHLSMPAQQCCTQLLQCAPGDRLRLECFPTHPWTQQRDVERERLAASAGA